MKRFTCQFKGCPEPHDVDRWWECPPCARRYAELSGMTMPDDAHPDAEIAPLVTILRAASIRTTASCQGGEGHAWQEPTVLIRGDRGEAKSAAHVAREAGYDVYGVSRTWRVVPLECLKGDTPYRLLESPRWELRLRSCVRQASAS